MRYKVLVVMATIISSSSPASSLFFFFNTSTCTSTSATTHLSNPSSSTPHLNLNLNLKKVCGQKLVLMRLKCLPNDDNDDDNHPVSVPISINNIKDKEKEKEASDSVIIMSSISSYKWCASLGGLGLLETSYLTYLKLTNSDAYCPLGSTTCANILNSNYSLLFGITSFTFFISISISIYAVCFT